MSLDDLRRRLSAVDDALVELIAQRQEIVSEVSAHKISTGAPTKQWVAVHRKHHALCERAGDLLGRVERDPPGPEPDRDDPEESEPRRQQERIEQELRIANQIQRKLLPRNIPQIHGIQAYGWMHPAKEVGGDYYDFVTSQDRQAL